MSDRQYHGFTLIELLIVIAILSLLASILLPSLNRAKEMAKRMACASNLKAVGLAQIVYSNDYGRKSPPAVWQGPPGSGTWRNILYLYGDYVDSKEAFHCPSVDHYLSSWYHYGQKHNIDVPLEYRTAKPPGYPDWQAIHFNRVKNPSSYYHIGDSANLPRWPKQWMTIRKTGGSPRGNDAVCLRHGVANMWFLDGHVESCSAYRLGDLGFIYMLDKNGQEVDDF
ncbi:MAG: prepilin-type N-terminal cleavage/methylation domain-containing protein [Phycisphaerae bacterium]|nr:prepilin-type N-terminal cleavage/methylation domain-containing protein [Phycisphaerae bacterium]